MRNVSVYALKPGFQGLLRPLADRWAQSGGTANQLTGLGFAASLVAGAAAWLGASDIRWLVAVPVMLLIRMALNAMDGMVARGHRQASDQGRVFNEMADVAGDAVSYLPFALLLTPQSALVVIVAVLAIVTEFAAVLDPAGRRNEGPLGKSDRAVVFGGIALALGLGIEPGTWITLTLAAAIGGLCATLWNRLRVST